ncbi:MSC_0624 family F1-like ATPase-associated membrane protein [Mesomycoplasma lagogenitalium]|uniref:Transmembrane protein n=1 Tax=Mesomycoplasma lagogenitalium TaxID=171286 RepID=A0ABY8LXK6_9BACT|nr:hypothetical protein [Mesomycoplasma lagogenitalium]WGI37001.1 hypothetical protein QEG99_01805 [Mesomycoplasma lagogenitalium]
MAIQHHQLARFFSWKNIKITNKMFLLLKYNLLFSLTIGLFFILLFKNFTLLGHDQGAQLLFNFNLPITRQFNFLLMTKTVILFFTFFYSLIKNYFELNFKREIVKIYLPWYFLYYLLTITSFILFFAFNPYKEFNNAINDPNLVYKYFGLTFILLIIILINISYSFYFYFSKKNKNKLKENHWISLAFSTSSQAILFLFFALIFWNLIEKEGQISTILNQGEFYNYLQQLFPVKNYKNILVIIFSVLIVSVLFIFANNSRILFLFKKENALKYFKNLLVVLTFILTTILLWFIIIISSERGFYKTIDNVDSFTISIIISQIILSLLITAIYIISFYIEKIKIKNQLMKNLYFLIVLLIMWSSLFVFSKYLYYQKEQNLLLLFNSLFSITAIFFYFKKNKKIDFYKIFFVFIFLSLLISFLFIESLILILVSNDNYHLLAINENLSTYDLFLILIISLTILSIISIFIELSIILLKIDFKKIQISKKGKIKNNEKI